MQSNNAVRVDHETACYVAGSLPGVRYCYTASTVSSEKPRHLRVNANAIDAPEGGVQIRCAAAMMSTQNFCAS
jgi:hypothetical protein